MRYTLTILWLIILATDSGAQERFDHQKADLLLHLPDDTAKINQLNDYAHSIQSASPKMQYPF